MPNPDQVLDVLSGRMTASDVAHRLGLDSPAGVVPVLNRLLDEGRVQRVVSDDVLARWSPAAS